MPSDAIQLIKRLYDCFNSRNIDGVLVALDEDVAWANGMDGGHVHGHDALRDYWTRQWAVVSPHVEPISFQYAQDGDVVVEVIQSVFDLNGQPLSGQTHGLKDKTVTHIFQLEGDKIKRFDIRD
ncbi:nuclear transport factor 2 family protein [Cellvibrio sp. ARAG 10.3]|uniref:nuclear transport factor 2 family protein n=1 Tax=Cellvibrio sp. ARAG 10.3 TaxID=3451358 RepID=UPI003F45E550